MSLRFYCAICYWTHVFLHLMLLITYVDKSQGTMASENLLILLGYCYSQLITIDS